MINELEFELILGNFSSNIVNYLSNCFVNYFTYIFFLIYLFYLGWGLLWITLETIISFKWLKFDVLK